MVNNFQRLSNCIFFDKCCNMSNSIHMGLTNHKSEETGDLTKNICPCQKRRLHVHFCCCLPWWPSFGFSSLFWQQIRLVTCIWANMNLTQPLWKYMVTQPWSTSQLREEWPYSTHAICQLSSSKKAGPHRSVISFKCCCCPCNNGGEFGTLAIKCHEQPKTAHSTADNRLELILPYP